MNANFTGLEEIAKFAQAIQIFLRNGKREGNGNQPRRVETDGEALQDVQDAPNESRSQEAKIFRQVSRLKNETEDIWKDGSMGPHERITAAATRLANNHRDNKTLRNDAMRAIGGNITMHLPLALYLIASLLPEFMSGLTDIMFEGHGPYV